MSLKLNSVLYLIVAISCLPTPVVAQQAGRSDARIAVLERRVPTERLEKARTWFQKTDLDQDGLVSREEFPEKLAHLWLVVETNNDGFLNWEEELEFQWIKHLLDWEARLTKTKKWFEKMDKDSDGKVSLEEFPESAMKFWPLANTDKDNFLTWEEELAYQRLEHEQVFIAEMSKVNRLAEIQHLLDNDVWPQENQKQDVTGVWLCFTTMSEHGNPGNGVMYMNLTQNGTNIEGDLQQLKGPNAKELVYERGDAGNVKGKYGAVIRGEMILATGDKPRHNMILLHRKNLENDFRAIFTGAVSADGNSVIAQLTNVNANYGTMLMVKRDSLFK